MVSIRLQRAYGRIGGVAAAFAATCLAVHSAGAGDLEPPGSTASTMKTLDEIYTRVGEALQPWTQVLVTDDGIPAPSANAGCNSSRFECLSPDASQVYRTVLDRETGLVWERNPHAGSPVNWPSARLECARRTTGGRLGWRLPSSAEIGSLADLGRGLPNNHPFTSVSSGARYWTNTVFTSVGGSLFANSGNVQALTMDIGAAGATVTNVDSTEGRRFWCVRGPNSGGL